MLIPPDLLRRKHAEAMPWADFMQLAEAAGQRGPWDERYGRLELDADQRRVAEGFVRPMPVLCLTGTWCGDCALQGAGLQRIAEAAGGTIDLRFLNREEQHAELIVPARINAGFRVPVTWFMAEDFEPVVAFGDRTLSRYRSMARRALEDAERLVHGEPPADPVREVLAEMLEVAERAHLILRTSTRLRALHGD